MIKCGVVALTTLMSLSIGAWTTEESNKTVRAVGAHVGIYGYVNFVESIHPNCLYGNLSYDISTPLGKSVQNILLLAKATGNKVKIGFTLPATSAVCYVELVEAL